MTTNLFPELLAHSSQHHAVSYRARNCICHSRKRANDFLERPAEYVVPASTRSFQKNTGAGNNICAKPR